MIVMAADYVGRKVVEYLCENQQKIDFLILDSGNRGGLNDSMRELVLRVNPQAELLNQMHIRKPAIQEHIRSRNLEIGVLAWWPHIIDEHQISLTRRGFVNTHPGYLPYNRGKHPYFWSIVDSTPFGVTLHYVNRDIDSGAIIAQEEIPVTWEDTGESLYCKSRERILQLFYKNFDSILNNTAAVQEQCLETGTFHYGKELDPVCSIELDQPYTARRLLNILRGRMFHGKGACSFVENGKKYTVSITIQKEIEADDRGEGNIPACFLHAGLFQ